MASSLDPSTRENVLEMLRDTVPELVAVYQWRGGKCMADDVVLNKPSIFERCLQRVREEYENDPSNLHDDITRQDAIILSLQRACPAAIDLAMRLVRKHDRRAAKRFLSSKKTDISILTRFSHERRSEAPDSHRIGVKQIVKVLRNVLLAGEAPQEYKSFWRSEAKSKNLTE